MDDSAAATSVPSTSESIKVLVRVRPLSDKEVTENNDSIVEIQDDKSLKVTSSDGKKSFQCSFDAVAGQSSNQAQVYDIVRGCTQSVLDGFNATIFAYGQTGSGKTYSMYGPPTYASAGKSAALRDTEFLGLIPRAVNEIFDSMTSRGSDVLEFSVYCSFVQIYNENLFDMLRDSTMVSPLSIREDKKEIYVQGLSEYHVKSVADTLQLLKIAEDNRAIRETHMNQFSSRSHSIFQIYVEQKRISAEDGGEISYRAKFNLVDLAGSEKWNTKAQMRDAHIAEMTNINLSLHTLGKCISSLAQVSILKAKEATAREQRLESRASLSSSMEKSGSSSFLTVLNNTSAQQTAAPPGSATPTKRPGTTAPSSLIHVPYRDSKLTRLLQDSLGGNAKTFLIATISPARINCEESISTLKFADRAKQVMVQAVLNETRPVDHALVKRLQEEVESLKALLKKLLEQNKEQSKVETDTGGVFAQPPNTGTSSLASQQLNNLSASYGKLSLAHLSANSGNSALNAPLVSNTAILQPIMPGGNSTNISNSAVVRGSTDLNTVSSLEKALNKEQSTTQHLLQKNETLIRELEALKTKHYQLILHQDELVKSNNQQQSLQSQQQSHQLSGSNGKGSQRYKNNRNSSGSDEDDENTPNTHKQHKQNQQNQQIPDPNLVHITPSQAAQVQRALAALAAENSSVWEACEGLQGVMKKFFKFELEEDDMRDQCSQIFARMKDLKKASKDDKDSVAAAQGGFSFLEWTPPSAESTAYGTSGDGSGEYSHSGTLPNIASSSHQKGRGHHSSSSSSGHHNSLPHLHNNSHNHNSHSLSHSQSEHFHSHSHNTGSDHSGKHKDDGNSKGSVTTALAYRVRGGAPNPSGGGNAQLRSSQQPQQQQQGPTSSSGNINMRGSNDGGWVLPSQGEEEDEEERLQREIKKAKKKAKKEAKLREWAQEKENKTMAELRQQQEERKAMKEAELQREERRKEYAQRQKDKLASYHQKVKAEGDKIQELLDLGIDPKSLNY